MEDDPLTNIRKVLENRALHRQLVEIRIQKGEDALRQWRGSFLAHSAGWLEAPVCTERRSIEEKDVGDQTRRCRGKSDSRSGRDSKMSPLAFLYAGASSGLARGEAERLVVCTVCKRSDGLI